MCLRRVRLNRKGISPVLATVIIVAVTITIAVAIAYWMGGIAGLYTRFEKIEIAYANVAWDDDLYGTNGGWKVMLKIKNTGSADATIDDILLNGITVTDVVYKIDQTVSNQSMVFVGTTDFPIVDTISSDGNDTISISLKSGSIAYLLITIPNNAQIGTGMATSGLSLEIKLHTAAGKEYPKIVTLT